MVPLFLIIIMIPFLFIEYRNRTIQKKVFPYGLTNKKIEIYDEEKNVVGTIQKNYSLYLTKSKLRNMRQYYQIKNTPFYVYYKDVKQIKKIDDTILSESIVASNKVVSSSGTITLKEDGKQWVTISIPIQLVVAYEDDDTYSVYFQNTVLQLAKSKELKEEVSVTTKIESADHVSVLFYEEIADTCYEKYCTTTEEFRNQLKALQENGYYTLNKQIFTQYLKGQVELKEKAIFLTSSTVDHLSSIMDEYQLQIYPVLGEETLHYYSTNHTNRGVTPIKEINRYQIKKNTSVERVLELASGMDGDPIEIDSQGIAVLNYHFFYDPNQGEKCNEIICLTTTKFREQLDFFQAEHFHTLKMNDFKRWMYGEIELPKRSVLITVDDGGIGTGKSNGNKLIPILEEYKMNATLFLIVNWFNVEDYRSPFLDIQSHTFDMHTYGACGRGEMNCASYDKVLEDLKLSLNVVDNADGFCYPFYSYSNTSIQAVKDAGFQLAFASGNIKATRYQDKYLVPRYSVLYDTPIDEFKRKVK